MNAMQMEYVLMANVYVLMDLQAKVVHKKHQQPFQVQFN
jgi:hypothetical protein